MGRGIPRKTLKETSRKDMKYLELTEDSLQNRAHDVLVFILQTLFSRIRLGYCYLYYSCLRSLLPIVYSVNKNITNMIYECK